MINFDKYAKEIYEQNKLVGWWDDPNRNVLETLQLVSTEIAEATEGERKNLMDDHLPHRKMGEVELADAMIRMLDIGGRCGWSASKESLASADHINDMVEHKQPVAALHSALNYIVSEISAEVDYRHGFEQCCTDKKMHAWYSEFLHAVVAVAESQDYDIELAMKEKLEYNKHRADHKRENRAADGGKKF